MHQVRRLGPPLRLLLVALAAALLALAGPSPAVATPKPSVSLEVSADTASAGGTVTLSGTASGLGRGRTLVAEVRTSPGTWRSLGRVAADDDGAFTLEVEPVLGPNDYRVQLRLGRVVRATSPVLTVSGLLAADPPVAKAGSPVSLSGQLPTPVVRPVELRGTTTDGPLPAVAATSDDHGRVSVEVTLTAGTTFVLHAPAVVVRGQRLPAFTSPPLVVEVEDAGGGEDPVTGSTTQVSERGGTQPRVSGDGSVVVYTVLVDNGTSGSPVRTSVFRWDRSSGEREEVSTGIGGVSADGTADGPTVSADGRFVAYFSNASNLVPGDDNGARDLFVFDADNATTERASTSVQGVGYASVAALSDDGRYLAYTSSATDVVEGDTDGAPDAFLLDRSTGRSTLVSHAAGDDAEPVGGSVVAVSADGDQVTFVSASEQVATADRHLGRDAFVWDAATGDNRLVSDLAPGAELGSVLAASADGQTVAYTEQTGMFVGRAFVWDAGTGQRTVLANPDDDGSDRQASEVASLSADGRYALVRWNTSKGRQDVFRVDRTRGVAVRLNGTEFEGSTQTTAYAGSLSDDGRFATFWSVVAGDAGRAESFLWDAQG